VVEPVEEGSFGVLLEAPLEDVLELGEVEGDEVEDEDDEDPDRESVL
jgi:hypothetical protein